MTGRSQTCAQLAAAVLAGHDERVRQAGQQVANAELGVRHSKERYDASPWPDRRLSEQLGQMEHVLQMRQECRVRLDSDPAYLLAVAVRDLLAADDASTRTAP